MEKMMEMIKYNTGDTIVKMVLFLIYVVNNGTQEKDDQCKMKKKNNQFLLNLRRL